MAEIYTKNNNKNTLSRTPKKVSNSEQVYPGLPTVVRKKEAA